MPKLELIVCPNPKCRRKIEEPILLSDLSTAPAERYYACPHCFVKLDVDIENDENITQESASGPPLRPSLEKVLDIISAQPQKQKEEKKKKEEPPVKPPEKKEKGPSKCAGYLGYLASLPKNKPIPQECLICPKVLDCVMKKSDSK